MTFQVLGLLLSSVVNETCLCYLSRAGAASGQPSFMAVCTSRTDAFSHSLSLNPCETCWPHHPTPLWGRNTQCLRGFRVTGHLIL